MLPNRRIPSDSGFASSETTSINRLNGIMIQ
ncbi:Uncharacterised protein [Vibrio cholerae]|nr:Uncharacterised protein [Vibrio cholerae]